MGLDQYLYAETYVSRNDSDNFKTLLEASGNTKFADTLAVNDLSTHAVISVNVAYWRKVNAIHKFFVDGFANGVDECQRIYVSRRDLIALRHNCQAVLENRSFADLILPTMAGFFFGSTDYDEEYFNDLKYTIDKLTEVLDSTDDDTTYYYQASW